ncbi:MAG: truB [Thermoleophilia bacterium]|nr:truB [Thermoleophilia bacterium]
MSDNGATRDGGVLTTPRSGYLLIDKPVGPSSNSAVQHVRRALGIGGRRGMKAGHAGTLDPFASGLLIVLVGRATRLMPFVVGHDKRYIVDVRFGASSTTDDTEGELTVDPSPAPTREAVHLALATIAASTEQIPPAVSALHIDGVRAYQRVRRGETVVVPPRPVRFHQIDLVEWHDARQHETGPRAVLDVRCGTGTYMRALARDVGVMVGQAAHCEALRRTEVGAWSLREPGADGPMAPQPVDASWSRLRDAAELVAALPRHRLADLAQVEEVARGTRVPLAGDHADLAAGPHVAVLAPNGALVAIAVPTADGLLQPRTVLIDPTPTHVG